MKGSQAPSLQLVVFALRELIEKNGVKNIYKKLKILLDNILECDRLFHVEKYAPIQSGRFAF
jgi:hypothetical protein